MKHALLISVCFKHSKQRVPYLKPIILSFFCLLPFLLVAQFTRVTIIDANTKTPVEGAHLWIAETEIGSFSDQFGKVQLAQIEEDLEVLCTHISYELFRSPLSRLMDTIFLNPLTQELDVIEFTAKSTPKQRRFLRQFLLALLGKTKNGKKTELLNPEVLKYHNKNGVLEVSAKEILHLDNPNTGYQIDLLLEFFRMKEDEVSYIVKPYFTSYASPSKDQLRFREETSNGSYVHFIKHFIQNTHRKAGYIANVVSQNKDGSMRVIASAKSTTLLKKTDDGYQLKTPALLQITYTHERDLISDPETLKGGLGALGRPAEIDMMNQEKNAISLGSHMQTSFIFLPSSKAQLDLQGLPKKADSVVFLGYWNYDGVGDLLPRNIKFVE